MRGDGVAGDQASSELTGAAVYVKCESLQFTIPSRIVVRS